MKVTLEKKKVSLERKENTPFSFFSANDKGEPTKKTKVGSCSRLQKRRMKFLKTKTWASVLKLSLRLWLITTQPGSLPYEGTLDDIRAVAAKSSPEVAESFVNTKGKGTKSWSFLPRGHPSDPWVYYLEQTINLAAFRIQNGFSQGSILPWSVSLSRHPCQEEEQRVHWLDIKGPIPIQDLQLTQPQFSWASAASPENNGIS